MRMVLFFCISSSVIFIFVGYSKGTYWTLKLAIKNVFSCFCFLKNVLVPSCKKSHAQCGESPAKWPPQLTKDFPALCDKKGCRFLRDGFAGCHLRSA